jgi:hypothetical protein
MSADASSSSVVPDRVNTRAVFLSYARQDAEAVRRIADALRGFAVEVWFDRVPVRQTRRAEVSG